MICKNQNWSNDDILEKVNTILVDFKIKKNLGMLMMVVVVLMNVMMKMMMKLREEKEN